MEKKVQLYFRIVTTRPDPVTYKPYSTDYEPEIKTFVRIDIPAKFVLENNKARVVLSPDGVACILRELGKISLLVTNN